MINLQNTQSLITTIALLLAYTASAIISGPLQALVAKWMGDSTAEDEGFLSLSPLKHIDPVGMFLIIITGFGWSTTVPIDPTCIKHNFRILRFLIAYGAKTIISLCIAAISLVLLTLFYGGHSLQTALVMFFSDSTVLQDLTRLYPQHSSLGIVCAIVLMAFIFINSFLATWSAINNSFQFALAVGLEHNYSYMQYAHYLQIIGPVVVLIFFGGQIHALFLTIIMKAAGFLSYALGVL